MSKGKYKRKRIRRQRRETLIRDVDLPKRVITILEEAKICTLEDLDNATDEAIMGITGIGKKAMEEIRLVKNV